MILNMATGEARGCVDYEKIGIQNILDEVCG